MSKIISWLKCSSWIRLVNLSNCVGEKSFSALYPTISSLRNTQNKRRKKILEWKLKNNKISSLITWQKRKENLIKRIYNFHFTKQRKRIQHWYVSWPQRRFFFLLLLLSAIHSFLFFQIPFNRRISSKIVMIFLTNENRMMT